MSKKRVLELRQTMKSDSMRCAEYAKFRKIDEAFRIGDLEALRAAVDDPGRVPNGPMPIAIGPCLVYAIYHSPLPFIRNLLENGADPPGRSLWVSATDRGTVVQPLAAGCAWTSRRR